MVRPQLLPSFQPVHSPHLENFPSSLLVFLHFFDICSPACPPPPHTHCWSKVCHLERLLGLRAHGSSQGGRLSGGPGHPIPCTFPVEERRRLLEHLWTGITGALGSESCKGSQDGGRRPVHSWALLLWLCFQSEKKGCPGERGLK